MQRATQASIALHGGVDPAFPVFSAGKIGVDIFFVISGFVMTLSSARYGAGLIPCARSSLVGWNELYPSTGFHYAAQIAAILVAPSLQKEPLQGAWRVTASYLFFLPLSGLPVVNQGWTLNYEMFFYVLFAITIGMKIKPLLLLGPRSGGIEYALPFSSKGSACYRKALRPHTIGVFIRNGVGGARHEPGFAPLQMTLDFFYAPCRSISRLITCASCGDSLIGVFRP